VDESIHEDNPRTIIKVVLTVVGILILFKGLQFLKPLMLRTPVRGYWVIKCVFIILKIWMIR